MMDDLLSQAIKYLRKYLLLATILLYGIGFLIHNVYLSSYKIANFELIKGKYVFGGIAFLLIFIFTGFFYKIGLSFSNPASNFKKENLLSWFFRFETLVLAVYYYFPGKESHLINYDINLFGIIPINPTRAEMLVTATVSMLILIAFLEIAFRGEAPPEKEIRTNMVFIALFIIPANFLLVWGLIFDPLFQRIFWFFGCYFIVVVLGEYGTATHVSLPYLESRFFRDKVDISKRRIEETVFRCIFTLPIIILLVSIYSKQLYSRLPANFGGAKPIIAKIYQTNSKPLDVKIIDETQTNYYVKPLQETQILIINKSQINKVEISY